MSEYAIALEGISKSFASVSVLRNVDFRLKKGTVHALVGGNGAGKSTLMKILSGIYTADGGVIRVGDSEVSMDSYNKAKELGIGLIFQELSLVPSLTVYENIFLNRDIMRCGVRDRAAMRARAAQVLHELGIDIDVDEQVKNLGVGYCQLIEIAKALSINASILIMDEPTASLSDKETEILFALIGRLKGKGVSIVYISHRMNEIFMVSDEISVLRDGEMVLTDATVNLTLKGIIDAMIGRSVERVMEWKERSRPVSDEVLLEITGLSDRGRLDNVSLTVRKGEVVGLAGLMGSGRTEIVERLFGLRRSTAGEIHLEGKRVEIGSVQQAIDLGIALVPEDRRIKGLVLRHSVEDNAVLPSMKALMRHGFLSRRESRLMTARIVADLDVKADGTAIQINKLSGGNQQKIVIGKWLQTEPRLLMMDEPTAGVDIKSKGEIIEIVRGFAERGNGVIFISSELSEMMAVCDRVYILRDGVITGELTRDRIENEETLQHAIQN